MKKQLLGACACAALLLIFSQGQAFAQTWENNTVRNSDFELEDFGTWTTTGNNGNTGIIKYTVLENNLSWCLKRKPGTPNGNGGFETTVYLEAGRTYAFDADIAGVATC